MSQEIDKIKSKFDELGFNDLGSISKDIDFLILKFENENDFVLPDAYKYFLKNFGECTFEHDAIYTPVHISSSMDPENFQDISFFYGVGSKYDISKILDRYIHRIPKNHIPIAELPGGDQLCMDVNINSSEYGKIYSWDHENESNGEYENVYLVANSFSDFINSFQKEEKENDIDSSIESFRFDF